MHLNRRKPFSQTLVTFLMAMVTLCLLSSCASTDLSKGNAKPLLIPEFNESLFASKVEQSKLFDIEELTQISLEQKQAFLDFYNAPKFALTPKHTRVATYLGLLVDQFTYSPKTFTAQQTLDSQSGNCLSLTLLSTALADLVGVDIHYQLLDQNPVYSISDNLLMTSDHLRAVLSSKAINAEGSILDSKSFIRIDYFDTDGLRYVDKVSLNQQNSLFYSNIAIELLSINYIDAAYVNAVRALEIDANNASALNTIAILHRKRGDLATAEKLYRFGAIHSSKASVFLRNYKSLLANQGRESDFNAFLDDKELLGQDSHPWEWVRAGRVAFNNGNFDEAVQYYEKALEIAPDVPEVHIFAGQASLAAGDKFSSRQFYIDAYKASKGSDDQQHYKRKLLALKSQLSQ